jgi:nucleoside-diphosphate-sugar epimerase
MTSALVIGGTGFVGAETCRELMWRGVETIAASRGVHPSGNFDRHVSFDRRDPVQLRSALETLRPDILIDLACFQPAEVVPVVEAFQGRRYLFVSTGVYPDVFAGPAAEEDFVPLEGPVPEAVQGYREGKRWCETVLARSSGLPWTVIRPPTIIGPGDPTLRIVAYLQRVEDGGPVLVPEESYQRQALLAWVKDVARLIAEAADLQRDCDGRAYNVAFEGVSLEDLLRGIGRGLGRQPDLVPVPFADLPPDASPYGPNPSRPAGLVLERSRRELGFEPSALEEALPETLSWYRATRPSHPGYAGRGRELELAATI